MDASFDSDLFVKTRGYSLCVPCKGAKLLCGKARCPLLVKFYSYSKTKPLIDSLEISGSSPPGVFVGRFGYPKVYVGPLIPPIKGDTSLMDKPELWSDLSIDEIVDFRFSLVRGKQLVHIKELEGNKLVESTREIALAKSYVDIDAEFTKKPRGKIALDDEVQPFGPSAPLKDLRIDVSKTNQKIESAYQDTDLKAKEAVLKLYEKGVFISDIQKAFSVGAFGLKKNRKFVPTRWSITAVDSTISSSLMEKTKEYPVINEYRVFEHTSFGNKWIVLMIPSFWSYEQFEGWYPKTLWNPGDKVEIISDWEGFKGRKTYAATGGCYYSTRLAINEYLVKERVQAAVITFREISPDYLLPLGVWLTRESIRNALKDKPLKFTTLNEALDHIAKKLSLPINKWIENSSLLSSFISQRKVIDFVQRQ